MRFQKWDLRALLGEHLGVTAGADVALSLLNPQAGCEGVTLLFEKLALLRIENESNLLMF